MRNPYRYFKTSPTVIQLAVMMYVRFPLSLRQVEDLLHERGIDVSYEAIRFWWNRFGSLVGKKLKQRQQRLHQGPDNWRWHLDEVFVKIKGETHYLWRAVDHEGTVLDALVTKKRDRHAALKFLKKQLKWYQAPETIVTDRLGSYRAALRRLGIASRQDVGRYTNNRAENSHLPFRRRERAMLGFRSMKTLQKFTAVQSAFTNHFNLERHLYKRSDFKANRDQALRAWRQISIAS